MQTLQRAAAGRRRPVLQPALQRPVGRTARRTSSSPGPVWASPSSRSRAAASRCSGGSGGRSGTASTSVIHPVDQAVACKYLLCRLPRRAPPLVRRPPATRPPRRAAGDHAARRTSWRPDWPAGWRSTRPTSRTPPRGSGPHWRRSATSRTHRRRTTSRRSSTASPARPSRSSTCSPSWPSARPPATCSPRTRPRCSTCSPSFPRVEIRGGAGSGKTWLAVEKARRLAAEGQRVALMCYSRGLAEFLKRRVEKLPKRQRPAYVGTFHNLGIGWGVPAGVGRRQPVLGGVPARPRWS